MERQYLYFNNRDMSVDVDTIETLFGCGDVVCTSFDHQTVKYAFYNTGHLCQVSYDKGSVYMKVEVFTGSDSRKEDVLHWLEQYLTYGMSRDGIGVDITHHNGFFFARFYEKDETEGTN